MAPAHLTAALALVLIAAVAALPPEERPPTGVPELCRRVREGPPEARAEAAAELVRDRRAEALEAASLILSEGDAGDARLLLEALADAPAADFTPAIVAASRRSDGVAEAALTALDRIGRTDPAGLATAAREGLLLSPLEGRTAWIAALGFARTERAIPDLIACLSGRDAEAAMAALRRLTTLPFTDARDWSYWWEDNRRSSLNEILADANRRMREENAGLKVALERETARANELERSALRDKLRIAREKKDAVAERHLLEKEFTNPQAALRAWAVDEARQALQPPDLLPAILKLLQADPAVSVRAAAVRSTGAIGREGAVEALRRCLGDAEPAIRVAAINALASAAGAAAAPDLRALLSPSEPRPVREAAIVELKALKPPDLAPEANRLLSAEWARPAAESLASPLIELVGALQDPSSVDVLVTILREAPDKTLRFRAAKSLGEIRSPRAVTPLITELDRPGAGREKDVTAEMVRALALAGGDDARRRLERVLGEFLTGDEANPKARENAGRGLARIGTPDSIRPLLACATSDPDAAVRKEAWEAAFALAQAAPKRLDALEGLLPGIGAGPAEAPWRVAVRSVIVKPANFPDAAERVRAHLRPLADDYFLLKDWPNALRVYDEVAALSPEDVGLAVRQVTCRVRTADIAGALASGEPLLTKAPATTAAGLELRRALLEARNGAPDIWRTLALVPARGVLAALPEADRDWFEGERRRLTALSQERHEEFLKRFADWAGATEEERKSVADLGRWVAPADLARVLLPSLEGTDPAAREAAARVVEAACAIVIPAEEGEPRRQALESWKHWVTRNTP